MGFLKNNPSAGIQTGAHAGGSPAPYAPYDGAQGYNAAPESGFASILYHMARQRAAQGIPTPLADKRHWDMGRPMTTADAPGAPTPGPLSQLLGNLF